MKYEINKAKRKPTKKKRKTCFVSQINFEMEMKMIDEVQS